MSKKNIIQNIDIPFDEIMIPSKGIFYDNKQSSFLVKYLTAKEENVLTSPSLTESGRAIEMVLESCVLDWDGDMNDILVGDKNAVLLYLRSTSYGDTIKYSYQCSKCNKETEDKIQLSALEMKDIHIKPDDKGLFSFILPKMKTKEKKDINIKFKPRTVGDEIKINTIIRDEKRVLNGNEIDNSIEARYTVQIKSINDNVDEKYIKQIIKMMPISDSYALRTFMDEVEPGIDNIVKTTCTNCQHVTNNIIPINSNFFGLTPEYRTNMMDEVFLISYYGKGGHTRSEIYKMPIYERRWTMERIAEEVDKRNQAEKAAAAKAKSSSKKV
jgi:hypothetical protein